MLNGSFKMGGSFTTWVALVLYLVPRVVAQRRNPHHMVSSP